MKFSQRVITQMPLQELWDDNGLIPAAWSRDLSAIQLRELLRQGRVRFVVAGVGAKPQWVPEADCFKFWKGEVRQHLAEPGEGVFLESFPGEYFYWASEWQGAGGSPIVVLQLYH